MRVPNDVWCVSSVVEAPSCNWYQLLFSGEKLRLVVCPVAGVASLPGREQAWVENRNFHVSSVAVDLGTDLFYGSHKRGVGAGAGGHIARKAIR